MVKKRQKDLDVKDVFPHRPGVSRRSVQRGKRNQKNTLKENAHKLLFGSRSTVRPSSKTQNGNAAPHISLSSIKVEPFVNLERLPMDNELKIALSHRSGFKAESDPVTSASGTFNITDEVVLTESSSPIVRPQLKLLNSTASGSKLCIKATSLVKPLLVNSTVSSLGVSGVSTSLKNSQSKMDIAQEPDDERFNTSKQDIDYMCLEEDEPMWNNNDIVDKKENLNHSVIQETLKCMARSNDRVSINKDDQTVEHNVQRIWRVNQTTSVVAFSVRVEVRGYATITCVRGEMAVHGCRLTRGQQVNTYAPVGYYNTMLENQSIGSISKENSLTDDIRSVFGNVPGLITEVVDFLASHIDSAVVKLTDLSLAHLQLCLSQIPVLRDAPGYRKLSARMMISEGEVLPKYSATCKRAVEYIGMRVSRGHPVRVVVCGAKNLGKSTLCRYIINSLLGHSKSQVLHLECDPSQSEFTPPGCLSLHSVVKPLIGPPWCTAQWPDFVEYFGAISADQKPDQYVACVETLMQRFQSLSAEEQHPLVVNTMGWHQGLGLHFLSAVVAIVKPTHVIQLSKEQGSYRNFSEFSILKVVDNDLFLPSHIKDGISKRLQYEVMPILVGNSSHRSDEVLLASVTRDLMTLAYFSRALLPTDAEVFHNVVHLFGRIAPFAVRWVDIAIDLGVDRVPKHLALAAINGCVVGLAQADESQLSSEHPDHPKVCTNSGPKEMLGFGFVRAVDVQKRVLFLVTPLEPESLMKVNVLMKIHGAVTPAWLYTSQNGKVSSSDGLPYYGEKKSGAGYVMSAVLKQQFKSKPKAKKSPKETTPRN